MMPHRQCALPRNRSWHALCPPASLPAAVGFAVLAMDTSPAWMLGNLLADIGRSYNRSFYLCPGALQRACPLMDVYQSEMRPHTSLHSTTHCRALCLVSLPHTCLRRQPPCSPTCVCRPLTGSLILSPDPARQQGRATQRRYTRAMPAHLTSPRPPTRRSCPVRRVVLECIIRRDATQRLSVALSLLVRASGIACEQAPDQGAWRPDEPAPKRLPPSRKEEQRS